LGYDEKRVRLCHVMREAETGEVLATGEHMMLSVEEDPVPGRLAEIWDGGHKDLAAPDFAGRAIREI